MSISQIAKKIKDSPANVSRKIASLDGKSLILSREERDEARGGRPRKICFLTRKAQEIVSLFEKISKPTLAKAQISVLIALSENNELSLATRKVAAKTLADEALSNSTLVLEYPKIKDMFDRAVNNYSGVEEDVRKGVLSILFASLPHITANKQTAQWFQNTIYPGLQKIASDAAETTNLRERAINILSKTAMLTNDPNLTTNSIDFLLDLYFKNTDSSKIVAYELVKFEDKHQTRIIKTITHNIKIEERRSAAEELLQLLINNWWGKQLSSPK
jgi:hypothetical protein